MATKKQLAELIIRRLSGGSPTEDSELDIREIMFTLDQLRDARIRIDTFNSIKAGYHEVSTDYLSQYEDVTILTNAAQSLRYITLPANPIDLPDEMGIYMISPMKNPEIGFYRIPGVGLPLYRGMSSVETEDITTYWVVGSTVYFKNVDPFISKVLVTMVASSKDIAEGANYPIPPDAEAEILEVLYQQYAPVQQTPHDEIEDGVK
jgi:hypothetical protein